MNPPDSRKQTTNSFLIEFVRLICILLILVGNLSDLKTPIFFAICKNSSVKSTKVSQHNNQWIFEAWNELPSGHKISFKIWHILILSAAVKMVS